jgi:hypothetical protein
MAEEKQTTAQQGAIPEILGPSISLNINVVGADYTTNAVPWRAGTIGGTFSPASPATLMLTLTVTKGLKPAAQQSVTSTAGGVSLTVSAANGTFNAPAGWPGSADVSYLDVDNYLVSVTGFINGSSVADSGAVEIVV